MSHFFSYTSLDSLKLIKIHKNIICPFPQLSDLFWAVSAMTKPGCGEIILVTHCIGWIHTKLYMKIPFKTTEGEAKTQNMQNMALRSFASNKC